MTVSSENTQRHSRKAGDGTVICKSCGADYAADIPNCPYCGTMNLPAAEEEYMGKLEAIHGNLESLGKLAGQRSRAHMKKAYRRLLIIAVIFVLAVTAGYVVHVKWAREQAEKEKEEYLWQREYFTQLDACYDTGDYDALRVLYQEASREGHDVWQYKRRAFCEYLVTLNYAEVSLQLAEQGDGDLETLFVNEMELYTLERQPDLSEEELNLLEERRAPLLEDFRARFPMTDEEFEGLRRILNKNGFMPYKEAREFLREKGMIE